MQATITIDMDNAAFENHPGIELARILRALANKAQDGDTSCSAFDVNGNKVGTLNITD